MSNTPVKVVRLAAIVGLLSLFGSVFAWADNRTDNIDVFLVVDKSLSMESKIDAVKSYINQSIIQDMLIPGDYLVVIAFYGQAQVLLSQQVGTDKKQIEQAVDSIRADGRWTDIGNALDKLKEVIDAKNYPDHRKYFMLITDGIQEAPPTSAYYSKNGQFNHAFLENTKTIQQKGWKIEILGIGTDTAAADLAKSVSGGFAAVSNNPTAQEIAQKTGQLLGMVQAADVRLSPIGPGGASTLTLKLSSTGYSNEQSVAIDKITLSIKGGSPVEIAQNQTVKIPPNGTIQAALPVSVSGLSAGTHEASLTFTFSGTNSFSPAVMTTTVRVNGFAENYRWYLVGGGAIVVLLVLLAFVLVRRGAQGGRVSFNLTIEGDLKQSNRFTLKEGGELFIQDSPMGFRAVASKIKDPIARIFFGGDGLKFEILKKERLTAPPTAPANLLGEKLSVKTNAGKTVTFLFEPS